MTADTVTVLRHPIPQTKIWKKDGTIEAHGEQKNYTLETRTVDSIHTLSTVLTELEADSHAAVIRGVYRGDETAKAEYPEEFVHGKVLRRKSLFRDDPHHYLMIDVDGYKTDRDALVDPVGAGLEWVAANLPNEFHGVSFHCQLSASFGHPSKPKGEFRGHIWFVSKTPYRSEQLRQWANRTGFKGDSSLFDTIQLHYTAAPVFEKGVNDPVTRRSGFLMGEFGDMVNLVISDDTGDGIPVSRQHKSTDLSDPNDWTAGISRIDPETVENVDRVKSALGAISADCSRDEWRNVLFALLSTGWACASGLCRDWSMTAPNRYDDDGLRNVLDSAKADRPNGITLGSLFAIAKGNGWVDPRKTKPQFDSYGDISNGRRFSERFRGSFLFVHASSTWYVWNGQRWKPCDTGEAMAAAKAIADECISETLSKLKQDGTEAAKRSHTQALGVHRSIQKLEAMLKAASTEPGMSIAHPGLFDADPLKINVRNGVLDLKTGQLLPALPEMYGSRLAGVEYDRLAQCPRWLDFVHVTMNGDIEMVAFMQRICGYALTGLVDEEVLFFFYGTGANGKSVFANVLLAAFSEYGITVRAALLARDHKGSGSDAEREKARLPGSRIALMNETGQADIWDDQRTKEMVSRENISARQLYAESFEFRPTHKLFIRGNHQPGAMDGSDGFWRRIVLIGFTRQLSEAERVPDLDRQIIERELQGVFAWMVDGCLHWQKHGLQIPRKVTDAVNAYRKDTDLLGEWLESECVRSTDAEVVSSELFTNYVDFLKAANVKAPSRSVFGRQLVQRGFRKRESNGKTFYVGLTIRCPFDPDEL